MNLELVLIKAFLEHTLFNTYAKYVDTEIMEDTLKNVYTAICRYYVDYPDSNNISIEELKTKFFFLYPKIKDQEIYINIFNQLDKVELKEELIKDIILSYIEKKYGHKIVEKLVPLLTAGKKDVLPEIEKILSEYKEAVKKEVTEDKYLQASLTDILSQEVYSEGLRWRLSGLERDIGLLRGGSLGHVFARVDSGKTTFLVSEMSNFGTQLKDDEIIAWYNNEERGTKVLLRLYNSFLNKSTAELVTMPDAQEQFIAMGGNRIKLFDSAVLSVKDIEESLKRYNVKLIVVDNGDKVSFKGDGKYDTVEKLKALYNHYRELAKGYDVDILTAGQASAEAHGRKWLEYTHMENSKTGKPGELDYAIGIGKTLDDETARYIHICKNKMKEGVHGKHTVLIDTARARYVDLAY